MKIKKKKKKSYFEIIYATIIKINDEIKEKKELEKIILCDVQIKIYPDLEKSFLNLFIILVIQVLNLKKK